MPHAVPPLQTPRLILEPLALADAAQIQALFPDIEVVRFMGTAIPWPYPPDGALAFIRDIALPAMVRGEQWHWTLRLRDQPDRIIGCLSLRATHTEGNRGFWLAPAFRRRGLMSEAVEAATAFWFDVLGFKTLRVHKAIENVGSRRISERSGMHVVDTFARDYVGGRFLSEAWEISAAEWRRRRSGRE